ncbi:MAG TPA: cytochrome c oxidase subunit 4 [Acidimicrobiales bacterium]|nr:cytochrome c oxidase subunit 4 [Acidimicrobiales bacterium]
MRVEAIFLLFIALFCLVVGLVYWMTSGEQSGTAMLIGVCLLGLFPGSYYLWWSRRMDPRAEDDPRASMDEGAGIIGAFPSSSVWPFVFGLGAAMTALALVFGFWTALFGLSLVLSAVVGIIIESRRGGVV